MNQDIHSCLKFWRYLLLAFLLPHPSLASEPSSERFLGLVEIPTVFGVSDPNGPPGQTLKSTASPLKLYAEPSKSSTALAKTIFSADLDSREHSYEEKSAVVLKIQDGWYLLKLKKGAPAWVPPEDGGKFHPYESLIKSSSVYLTGNWNNLLWAEPSKAAKQINLMKEDKKETPSLGWSESQSNIEIIESRIIEGQLWFKVKSRHSQCGEQNGAKPFVGWLPGHNEEGHANVWFYSRGC